MLFIGIFLMLICAYLAWREYSLYLGREMRELSELIAFARTMRERMRCYLEPPSAWIRTYSTPELERVGFLGAIRDGGDLCEAYDAVVDEMCVGREAKDAFAAMLSDMGRGYLDGELAAIDAAVDKLCASERRVTDDYKNKTRAAGAMIAAVAVGAVILVI